jgi:hypothetical protein
MPTIIEDDPNYTPPCMHPEHNPPTHISVPPGKRLRHTCPKCGQETIVVGSSPYRLQWGGRGVLDCPEFS